MYQQITDFIARFVQLEDAKVDAFTSLLTRKWLGKKELLLSAGQYCTTIYFINEGCLRYYYLVDGEEKTAQFFFENGWYTDYESFLSGQPSNSYANTLEPTNLWCIEKNDLYAYYDRVPEFERFGRIMAEKAYLGIRQRTKSLTNLSAEDRYLRLLNHRPKVIDRIPQHYIASYLNIRPQSLSRIRQQLARKAE